MAWFLTDTFLKFLENLFLKDDRVAMKENNKSKSGLQVDDHEEEKLCRTCHVISVFFFINSVSSHPNTHSSKIYIKMLHFKIPSW